MLRIANILHKCPNLKKLSRLDATNSDLHSRSGNALSHHVQRNSTSLFRQHILTPVNSSKRFVHGSVTNLFHGKELKHKTSSDRASDRENADVTTRVERDRAKVLDQPATLTNAKNHSNALVDVWKLYKLKEANAALIILSATVVFLGIKALSSLQESKNSPDFVDRKLLEELESSKLVNMCVKFMKEDYDELCDERKQLILRELYVHVLIGLGLTMVVTTIWKHYYIALVVEKTFGATKQAKSLAPVGFTKDAEKKHRRVK